MTHATFREDGKTLHHISSENGITGILSTAGLLAEAINYRNGHKPGSTVAPSFSLSVVSPGLDGVFSIDGAISPFLGNLRIDEYLIRAVGSFWLVN